MAITLEQIFRGILRGPLLTKVPTNPWADTVTLNAGSAFQTISTTNIKSNSIILLGNQVGSIGTGANSGGALVVNSFVQGTSFVIATATGVGSPYSQKVHYLILNRT